MKKHILFISLSYTLLTACGSSVSLSDNYFEDENFYNPALPAPLFATSSAVQATSSNPAEALNYDSHWGNEQDSSTIPHAASSTPSWGGTWSAQPGMNYGQTYTIMPMSFWQWRLYQQQLQFNLQPFGWGTSPYSNNYYHQGYQPWGWNMGGAWSSSWYDPWNPYGYGFGYYNGWNNMWYDPWTPYGYGGPIWYNGAGNGWNSGNNNGISNGRSGTNYGGRRPSKYNTSRGNSSSSGRTTGQTPTDTPSRNPYGDVKDVRGESPRKNQSTPSLAPRRKVQRSSDDGGTNIQRNSPSTERARPTRERTSPARSTETRSNRNSSVNRPQRTAPTSPPASMRNTSSPSRSTQRMESQPSSRTYSPSNSGSSRVRSSSSSSTSSGRRR